MNDKHDKPQSVDLDLFFDASRDTPAIVTPEFLARLENDAIAAIQKRAVSMPRQSIAAQVLGVLGGWPGIAGLATACAVGIWVGVNPPDGISSIWSVQEAGLGGLGLDPLNGYDLTLIEG